jgi:hypothetical protein
MPYIDRRFFRLLVLTGTEREIRAAAASQLLRERINELGIPAVGGNSCQFHSSGGRSRVD